jgi:hypothetical protein
MVKVIRISLFLGGALVAWGFWLVELRWVKGWAGLAWLSGFNWSVLPACAVIVLMASYCVTADARWPRRVMFLGVGWAIAVSAFAMARWAAFELFSGGFPGRAVPGPGFVLLIAWLMVPVGFTIAGKRWLGPLHYWTGTLMAADLLMVLPLSFLTIKVFPALNGSTDQIHAIKMGYPVFWTAMLIPAAMGLGRKDGRFSRAR